MYHCNSWQHPVFTSPVLRGVAVEVGGVVELEADRLYGNLMKSEQGCKWMQYVPTEVPHESKS